MATVTKLGPSDHGRPMDYEEFLSGDYEPGYKYELIDGRLYVSPQPNPSEHLLERWLDRKLIAYSERHPEVVNFIAVKSRVAVADRPGVTRPEPDIAAYHSFPLEPPAGEFRWEDYSPILVVEVLVESDPDKDLVRNVELYFQVPSIREYWVLDGRADARRPSLRVHRRYGRRWVIRDFEAGTTFTTRLLPGFELVIDPRQ
jgi:Uma2 family endonuclease